MDTASAREASRGVPWQLVQFTIPGVVIGGQVGPQLQRRVGGDRARMEKMLGGVFLALGLLVGCSALVAG